MKLIDAGGCPLVMEKDDGYGKTTLHYVCSNYAWRSYKDLNIVIMKMIEVGGQEIVMEKIKCGRTALNWVCECLRVQDLTFVIMKMIEIGGRKLVQDHRSKYDGLTILHYACERKASTQVILKMIELGGRELVMRTNGRNYDSGGLTALHYACRYNTSTEVILKMIQLGGQELVMNNHDGMTALHYACANKASIEVVILLVLVGGCQLVMEQTEYGHTALNYAYRYNAPIQVVKMLERFNSTSVDGEDEETTKGIIIAFIEGMTINQKRSLLHVAVRNGLKWSIITKLVESNVDDDAVNGYDSLTGLRLFMIAAIGNYHFSDLSSVYGLMRMSPSAT